MELTRNLSVENGARPVRPSRRDYSFTRNFGVTDPAQFPAEYDCDAGLTNPDQNEDGHPVGCRIYTSLELCQDEDRELYDLDNFAGSVSLVENQPPFSAGDIRDALKALLVYGVKKPNDPPGANFSNRRGGYFNVTDSIELDAFDDMRNALWLSRMSRRSISFGSPWFSEWSRIGDDGILPDFVAPKELGGGIAGLLTRIFGQSSGGYSWHNWKISGWTTYFGEPYLIGKPWLGARRGKKGKVLISRERFNKLEALWGVAAFTVAKYDMSANLTVRIAIIQTILSFLHRLVSQRPSEAKNAPSSPATPPVAEPSPAPPPVAPVPVAEPPKPKPTGVDYGKWPDLVKALIKVESEGNDNAIGDKHLANKAYGCLQIRKPVCDDVNRVYRTKLTPQMMLGNRQLSIDTFYDYMAIYATTKQLGHEPTHQDRARCWNGGPTGWKKQSTVGYWGKVRKFL